MNFASVIYMYLFTNPLRLLYLCGPSYGSLGFWEGKSLTEICSIESGVTELMWMSNMSDCTQLVDKKFVAFRIAVESIIYCTCIFITLRMLMQLIAFRLTDKYLYRQRDREIHSALMTALTISKENNSVLQKK
jgi:hypothetical protein